MHMGCRRGGFKLGGEEGGGMRRWRLEGGNGSIMLNVLLFAEFSFE